MKFKSVFQITIALLSSTALISFAAGAEFIVSVPTIVPNGDAGNIIDGNDQLTITTSGSIATAFPGDDGLFAGGDDNSLFNFGQISTIGNVAEGIYGFGGNIVTNSGNISTLGDDSDGIDMVGDSNMVTNTGTISTKGADSRGIVANDDNKINNSGKVTTKGNNSTGIQARDRATVINTGAVLTEGTFAAAMLVRDASTLQNDGSVATSSGNSTGIGGLNDNKISNTGKITTSGNTAVGIGGANNNTILNSGTVDTKGTRGWGIAVQQGNTVTNTGTINTAGEEADGVRLLGTTNNATNRGMITVSGTNAYGMSALADANTLNNTGSITTNGFGGAGLGSTGGNKLTITNSGSITTNLEAHGILVINDSTVTNTGSILTKGTQGRGIVGVIGNTINHSGKIVAVQTDAIMFSGSDNFLDLSSPAFIGGRIDMGNANAVNITTGRSHSTLWDFSTHGANFSFAASGLVPFAWNATTEQFATIDPTAFAAAPDVLANMTRQLSDLSKSKQDKEWWMSGYGNFAGKPAQGIYQNYKSSVGGLAAGVNNSVDQNLAIGAFASLQMSSLNVNSNWVTSQTITGTSLVAGFNSRLSAQNAFLELALNGGGSSNNSDRFVNDNLSPLGEAHAMAEFNSWFLAPELRLGIELETEGEWTLTPTVHARFSNQWIEAYAETGSNANATIDARNVQLFEGGVELAGSRDIKNGNITVAGGILYRENLGGTTQGVTLLGKNLAIPVPIGGALSGFIGVDADFELAETSTLSLSAKAIFDQTGAYNFNSAVIFRNEF